MEKRMETWSVIRDRRRHQYWRAALVGIGAGSIALLFQTSLYWAERARVLLLEHLHAVHPAWGWLVLPAIAGAIGALVGWATSRFSPEAAGSGIPHVKSVLMHVGTMRWPRLLPVKFLGGTLCIGAGFSLGREGPTIQMGAAMASLVSDVLRVPERAKPRLMACGAGAGLAAAFHAPLAGFIFTVEELQREFSSLTYAMALIAAVVADIIATSFWGSGNVFHATGFPTPSLLALPMYALVGVVAGLAGTVFNKSLLSLRETTQRVRLPHAARAGAIGVLVGLAAWWLPEAAGGGHYIAEALIHGDYTGAGAVRFLLLLLAGKFVLTLLSYMAGVPGGIFAPMLVMGASLGLICGIGATSLAPNLVPAPESVAAMGMAAFFAAVVRAPLTGIVLVLEMTSDWDQLLPVLTASMVAYLLSERLNVAPIYEALLAGDLARAESGLPVHREPILLEFVVQQDSVMDGKCLKDIPLPERCLLVTISRQGHELLPNGQTMIHGGDQVTAVLSGAEAGSAVARVLSLGKGET